MGYNARCGVGVVDTQWKCVVSSDSDLHSLLLFCPGTCFLILDTIFYEKPYINILSMTGTTTTVRSQISSFSIFPNTSLLALHRQFLQLLHKSSEELRPAHSKGDFHMCRRTKNEFSCQRHLHA